MKNLAQSLAALAALTLMTAAPALADHHEAGEEASDHWAGFRAGGNEPFWSLTIGEERFQFEHMSVFSAEAPRTGPGFTPNGTVFMARSEDGEQRDFIILVEDRLCSDTMSGLPFPKTVRVFVKGQHFAGCGGDTRSLLTGVEWRVTGMAGEDVPASTGQTLQFDADNRISGSGGCNRFNTSYDLGEGIGFGPIAATRRACINPEISRLEDQLFAALGTVISFEIGEDGVLTLFDENDPVLTAQR
jgi:heat shock protein HslJ